MKSMSPTTKRIQAILVAVPAMPVNPKMAATMAMIKNVIAHENICLPSVAVVEQLNFQALSRLTSFQAGGHFLLPVMRVDEGYGTNAP